jgi:hypothetical protein
MRLSQILETLGAVAKYIPVTTATVYLTQKELVEGNNIVGVKSGVATTVYIPADLPQTYIIHVKDELGVAGTFPITLEVY